jgi:hypothetical protein
MYIFMTQCDNELHVPSCSGSLVMTTKHTAKHIALFLKIHHHTNILAFVIEQGGSGGSLVPSLCPQNSQ